MWPNTPLLSTTHCYTLLHHKTHCYTLLHHTTHTALCVTHTLLHYTCVAHHCQCGSSVCDTHAVPKCVYWYTLYSVHSVSHTLYQRGSVEAWTKLCGLREKSHGWRYQATGMDTTVVLLLNTGYSWKVPRQSPIKIAFLLEIFSIVLLWLYFLGGVSGLLLAAPAAQYLPLLT